MTLLAQKNKDLIELRFSYDPFLLSIVKQIPGRQFVDDGGPEKYWTVPFDQKNLLERLYNKVEWLEDPSAIKIDLSKKNLSSDITYFNEMSLKPYPFQVLGANFLVDNQCAFLFDEMGLGKTMQVIGGVFKLWRQKKAKRSLIICPSSLKYQWEEELQKFLDLDKYGIKYIVVDGTPKQRQKIYDRIVNEDILFVFINYELVKNDNDILRTIKWDIISLDEAHRAKNPESKTTQAIWKLKAPYKWMCTGTPVQNKPEELHTLFQFVNPKVLGSFWSFRKDHIIIGEKFNQKNVILGYKNLSKLHEKIYPYMIRRLKVDVAPDLPDIINKNVYIDMYPEQQAIHDRIKNDLLDKIKEFSDSIERDENGKVIKKDPKSDMTQGMFILLQEICDAPILLKMSDSRMAHSYSIDKCKSPKIDELVNILTEFTQTNPEGKAVIFSQFARIQDLINEAIQKAGLGKAVFVNGSMNAVEKQQAIVQFKLDPANKFIIASDAANYGVNLENASLLINVDIPWNPAVYDQRAARIHRLSSKHESVTVINLIARDGIDERMLDVLYNKRDIASTIIEIRDNEREHLQFLTRNILSRLLK